MSPETLWASWTGWVGVALMLVGLFFTVTAAVGFIRLPDVYCRLHITGILDTLGVPLILLGAAFIAGPGFIAGKLLLCVVFLYGTSPLVGHLLARAALDSGQIPSPETRGISHRKRPTKKGEDPVAESRP